MIDPIDYKNKIIFNHPKSKKYHDFYKQYYVRLEKYFIKICYFINCNYNIYKYILRTKDKKIC